MTINEFLTSPSDTAKRDGPYNKIVLSSRVRLARNVKGMPFPGWAKKPDRIKALELVRPAIESLPQMGDSFSEPMDNLTVLDTNLLAAPHLNRSEPAPTTPDR